MLQSPIIEDNGRKVYHGTDKTLFVEFFYIPKMRTKAPINPMDPTGDKLPSLPVEVVTDEKGKIVSDLIPHIRVFTPGSRTTETVREVRMQSDNGVPSDPQRFPVQWAAFLKGEEQKASGYPLSELGLGDREIKAFHERYVYTVEALLEVQDGLLPDIVLGARSIREKARIWYENKQKENTISQDLKDTIKKQEGEIEALKELVAKLMASLHDEQSQERVLEDGPKRRGRPPKT